MKEATHVVLVSKDARRQGRDEVRSGSGRGRQPVVGQKGDQSLQVERTPGSRQQHRHKLAVEEPTSREEVESVSLFTSAPIGRGQLEVRRRERTQARARQSPE